MEGVLCKTKKLNRANLRKIKVQRTSWQLFGWQLKKPSSLSSKMQHCNVTAVARQRKKQERALEFSLFSSTTKSSKRNLWEIDLPWIPLKNASTSSMSPRLPSKLNATMVRVPPPSLYIYIHLYDTYDSFNPTCMILLLHWELKDWIFSAQWAELTSVLKLGCFHLQSSSCF